MSTIDEVLAAAEVVDAVCVIDGETRIISVPTEYKELGVESDEKVTRVKFQCPKIVGDSIDLTEYNLYINYKNASNKLNSYLVKDVTVTGDTINFSWLLSRHVTESPGTISYIVCAKKSDDTGVINEWNTKVATGIVGIGLEATEEIEEQNIDAIEQILRSIVELENKVDPEAVQQIVEDYLTANPPTITESDPTVPAWAKQPQKPTYTAAEVGALPTTYTPPDQTAEQVGADPAGTAASAVSQHNTDATSHNDLRIALKGLSDRINVVLDSDDTTLDQMSEVVAYIKSNKSMIDAITTSKVSMSDIVDDLTTNVSNKPLSAAQGVVIKTLIDALSNDKLDAAELTNAINTALAQAKASGEFDGADGQDGQNGITPTIGDNGNWYLGGTDTGKPSRGETGAPGPAGQQGEKGDKGDTGPQGPKGDKGDTGPQGPKGDTGLRGETGSTGATGATGDPGVDGLSMYVTTEDGYSDNCPFETASIKTSGRTVVNGDLILTPSGRLYRVYNADSESVDAMYVATLKGDTGATGPQGEKGDTGPAGPQGPKGKTGATGPQGPQGEIGPVGAIPNIQIGTVETLAAGSHATASMGGTPENPILNLGIPQGASGSGGSGISVSGATVGQTVRISAVDDNGVPTAWEAVDLPSGGGVSDIQIDGASIVGDDGKAVIPVAGYGKYGLIKYSSASHYGHIIIEKDGTPMISFEGQDNGEDWLVMRVRNPVYKIPLLAKGFDLMVKHAMCDTGTATSGYAAPLIWSDAERISALLRLGCTVDDNGFVKWTAQEVAV